MEREIFTGLDMVDAVKAEGQAAHRASGFANQPVSNIPRFTGKRRLVARGHERNIHPAPGLIDLVINEARDRVTAVSLAMRTANGIANTDNVAPSVKEGGSVLL